MTLHDEVKRALKAYKRTGGKARELPSVRKSVPRAFLTPVDDLVAALEEALRRDEAER